MNFTGDLIRAKLVWLTGLIWSTDHKLRTSYRDMHGEKIGVERGGTDRENSEHTLT